MSAPDDRLRLPGEHALDQQVMVRRGGQWELAGSKCPSCDRYFYPPRALCSEDLAECETVVLSRTGTVYSAVQVNVGPVGFPAPYWVAWIDLPENVRVFTTLDVTDGGRSPEQGCRAELAPRVVRTEPAEVLGPVFRLL